MKKLISYILHFKTPNGVIELADYLCVFILKNSTNFTDVYKDIYNTKGTETNVNITSICSNSIEYEISPRLIGLYYNKNTKLVMYTRINSGDINENILLYLENIFEIYSQKTYNYNRSLQQSKRIFFKLSDIKNILSDIDQEDFELFSNTKNYKI